MHKPLDLKFFSKDLVTFRLNLRRNVTKSLLKIFKSNGLCMLF
jgi:hypothetical protein